MGSKVVPIVYCEETRLELEARESASAPMALVVRMRPLGEAQDMGFKVKRTQTTSPSIFSHVVSIRV